MAKKADIVGAKAGAKPKKPYIQQDTVGSTQAAEIVYGIGDGENVGLINGLNSIILDGTRVVGDSGEVNYNEVKYEERFGLIDQEPLKLIEDTSTERGLNLEARSASPVVSTFNNVDVDKYVVRMSIPQLMQNKDNGDSVATSVSYAIDVAVDGGAYETVLETTINEKITNGYEIDHEIDAPAGSSRTIRVRRITPDSTSQLISNKIYVAAITEVINAKFSYPTIHHIGLVFNAEQFNNIPKVVFHYKGRKIKVPVNYNPETRTYTGLWNGTFKVVYSNNPAWILYDILTDRRSGLGRRIPTELIDKWELYRIAQYCDELVPDGKGGMEPRFECNNLVLNSRQDAYQVLKDIASIFRGQSFWNGSQVVTVADAPRDIDYAISMASVLSYSYSGTARNARHNVVKVQYYDKNNENAAAYEYATDYDSIRETEQINEVEIRAFGCTSAGQAQRLARYTLLSEQTETRILTAKVALDSFVNMQLGDVFAWSDKFLAGADNGGRVVASTGDVLTLDRDVTNSAIVGDTLVVNTGSGKASTRTITAVNGNKVTLDESLVDVNPEYVWVIDSSELSLLYFKLDDYKINASEHTVDIVGIQHVRSKFSSVDNDTALEVPTFSKVEIEALRAPDNVTLNYNVRVDQGINKSDLYAAWKQVKGATKYTVEFRRDDQSWRLLGTVTGLTHTIEDVSSGIYELRVRAADSLGNLSPYGYSSPLSVSGATLPPPKLSLFTATGKLLAIETKWAYPKGAESSLAVVIEHSTSDPAIVGAVTQKLNIPYPQTQYTFNGLGAHTKMWFRAAILDKYGQEGEFSAWVNATADANPEELIDLISGHINEGTLDQTLKGKIDGAGALAGEAHTLANQAKTAASNAQTTADGAATAAADAAGKATAAANAAAKEATDRAAAITAEAKARNDGLAKEATDRAAAIAKETTDRTAAITKEATDRAAAISKESTDRATALTAQANTLKADSAAKVKALKDEVDPKIATLQNGITQVTTDYKAGDAAVVGQLNSYKTSNDSSVASVLQKAESAVSTGSTNSSAITAINGQISTINGALSTKLDASVIAGYYTKGQTEAKAAEIAAGKVEEFNANLKIGGANLYSGDNPIPMQYQTGSGIYLSTDASANSRQFYRYLQEGWLNLQELSVGDDVVTSIEIMVPSDSVVGEHAIRLSTYRFGSTGYQNGAFKPLKEFPRDKWIKVSLPAGKFAGTSVTSPASINISLYLSSRDVGTSFKWRNLMMEKGTKASDFSESNKSVNSKIDANSTAIQNTNAEVTRVDGVATAANNATTALAGRVSTVEGAVSTKAEAAAVAALTTRVSNAEGVNTSQGSAITTLENTVNHATTGLASKASSSALTAVDNKVTAANGRIDTANAATTALEGRVSTVEGDVSKKADASALTALTTRVGNAEGVNTSQGSAITTLQNTVNHATTGLATKASTAALTATNSEVSRVDGVVKGHSNQLTQLSSDIATINGTLATKANASALNDIYTKTQTDAKAAEIAAGKVEEFNANLVIGGQNLVPNSKLNFRTGGTSSTNATRLLREILADGSLKITSTSEFTTGYISNWQGASTTFDNLLQELRHNEDFTVTVWFKAVDLENLPVRAPTLYLTSKLGYVRLEGDVSALSTGREVPFSYTRKWDSEITFIQPHFTVESYSIGGGYIVTKWQLERGNKSTDWTPAEVDVTSAIGANSTAINNTNAEVARVDGRVTATNSNVTTLSGRVSVVEGAVSTKAEAAALNSLATRVGTVEGGVSSQGTAITNLQNTINHATTGLASKASTAALTATNSEVTRINGVVSGHTSQLTQLTSDINAINGTLATKANASALNDIYTKTQTDAKAAEIAAGQIATYDANLVIGGTNLQDNADFKSNSLNRWSGIYGSVSSIDGGIQYKGTSVNAAARLHKTLVDMVVGQTYTLSVWVKSPVPLDFKAPVDVTEVSKTIPEAHNPEEFQRYTYTFIPSIATGGIVRAYISNIALTDTLIINKEKLELGSKGTDWSPSTSDVQKQIDANSTAIQNTQASVTQANGRIDATNSAATALTGRVATVEGDISKKADASALNSLTTRVATEEGKSTSQGAAITALENSVNHATTGLATKASSTALTAVDNKVTAVDGRVNTTNSNVATLTGRVATVEGAVATKAEAAAVTALTSRVGDVEGGLASASSNITSLTNSLDASISAIRLVPTQVAVDAAVKTRTDGVIELMDDASTTVPKVIKVKAGTAYNMFAGPHVQLNPNTLYKVSYKVKRLSGTGTFYLAVMPLTQDKANGVNNANTLHSINTITSTTYPFSGTTAAAPTDVWKEGVYYIKGVNPAGASGSGTLASPRIMPNLAAFLRLGAIVPANTEFALEYFTVEAADADALDAVTSAAITATNSEVARVDGRVTSTNSNVTALTGRVSKVEGDVATKADVSAVNALTTRVGAVEGGLATQATNTTNLTASLAATDKIAKNALPQIGGAGSFKTFKEVLNYYLASSSSSSNIVIETSITTANNMFRISGKGYNYASTKTAIDFEVGGYARSSGFIQHGAKNAGTFPMRIRLGMKDGKVCVILSPKGSNFAYPAFAVDAAVSYGSVSDSFKDGWSASAVTEESLASSGITGIMEPSLLDISDELAANASAISTTNAAVTRIDGVVSGHTDQITNLTTSIAGKADASALSSLTARVVAEEGKSTSQGTAITNLENAVNNSTTGLASKASAQALTTLNNQVQHSTTGLSAVNTKVDNLKATIENTTNGLASKASSSALDTLANKVNHSTTGLDAIASKTTVLESDVSQALDVVTVKDTRSTNQPPSWYWTNYPKRVVNEFKSQSAIGVSGFFGGTYCNLETKVYYGDSSGGAIIQTATSAADPSLYVQRTSSGSSTAAVWTAWAQPIKDLRDGLAGKASASAVESLTTRVSNAEGTISSEATKLSNLTTTVGGHTTTINSQTTSINGIRGVHALKIETNGVISGYGLVSELINGQVKSQFGVNADSFFIGAPSNNKKPFVVLTSSGTINGVTVPAGTYIDTAFIANATIKSAQIADAAITNAKISGAIQSNDYVAGSTGWKIDKAGGFEMNGTSSSGKVVIKAGGVYGYYANGKPMFKLGV